MVAGIDEPFTCTILRREGMSGTTLTLAYSEKDEKEMDVSIFGEECIDDGAAGLFS